MFATKNIIERFVWTALQAFIGALPASVALTTDELSAVGWAGLSAAIASVISLAKNLTAEGIIVQEVKRTNE